jgi:hypothetical protein
MSVMVALQRLHHSSMISNGTTSQLIMDNKQIIKKLTSHTFCLASVPSYAHNTSTTSELFACPESQKIQRGLLLCQQKLKENRSDSRNKKGCILSATSLCGSNWIAQRIPNWNTNLRNDFVSTLNRSTLALCLYPHFGWCLSRPTSASHPPSRWDNATAILFVAIILVFPFCFLRDAPFRWRWLRSYLKWQHHVAVVLPVVLMFK